MKIIDWLLIKLNEESTWRGIILAGTIAGANLNPEQWQAIMSVGLSVIALINVIKKQSASKAAVADAINDATRPLRGPLVPSDIPRAVLIDTKTLLPK